MEGRRVVRPFANVNQEAVHAPVDTSFTGRALAAVNKWGTLSNVNDAFKLNSARMMDIDVDVSDDKLLSGIPEDMHYKILEEKASGNGYSAMMLRDQLLEDLKSDKIMDRTGTVAQFGYGLAAVALDPTTWIGGAGAAKAGVKAGQLAYNAAARGLLSAGAARSTAINVARTAETVGAWTTGAAAESVMFNGARLQGNHLYEQSEFINDVVTDTLMGAGIGGLIRGGSKLRQSQRRKHAAQMRDLQANKELAERRNNGDWSDFELDSRHKELNAVFGNKSTFSDNIDKHVHGKLLDELDVINTSVNKIQGLQGDAGLAMKTVMLDEVQALTDRIKMHNRSPEDAVAILDDMASLNTRLANTSGIYKQVANMQGDVAVATMRNILREQMETSLESIVDDVSSKVMSASQMKRMTAMRLSAPVKALIDEAIGLAKLAPNDAGRIAMVASRLEMYYKGKLPKSYTRATHFVLESMRKGDTQGAVKLLDIMDKAIPERVTGHEFKLDMTTTLKNPVPKDIKNGDLPVWQVKEVLDGMENSQELMQKLKGANAVFGNIDEKAVEIPDEVAQVVGSKLFNDSYGKLKKAVDTYSQGEMHIVDHAAKPQDWIAKLGQWAGEAFGLTKDLATRLKEVKSTTMHYVGSRFTELGRGYSGSVTRRHSAAVIKEAELTKALSLVLPSYDRNIKGWLAAKGYNAVKRYNAANKTGLDNELARQFNIEFMSHMNNLKLGKQSVPNKHIAALVTDWNEFMNHNHGLLVKNGIEGFTADRKIANYVPQIWLKGKLTHELRDDPRVREVLIAGYRNAGNKQPDKAADALLDWAHGEVDDVDQFMPKLDARAQTRTEIDWSAEVDGLSVMDLLDTESAALATKYANRTAGWVGIAKASDGAVRSGTDLNVLRAMAEAETNSSEKAMLMFDDTFDLLFGRPTRGGNSEWSNNLKKLATLSKMGALGTAQAAETGVVATRAIMESAQDVKFIRKILQYSGSNESKYNDLLELTKLTGYDKDYALLNRASVNLDVRNGYDIPTFEHMLNNVTDVMTFGSAKDSGMRALGQVTGHDTVRKYLSYVAQRGYGAAVARHFKYGKSKISNARLADYGLTDINGKNVRMRNEIDKHVVFDADGYPESYNFDKWDAHVLDEFRYSMQRMEAQTILRALAGELPPWMNKPAMSVLMQFRQMGITANNKSLARNMAFGDKEAVAEMTLATMSATVVRAAKIAGLASMAAAIKGTDFEEEYNTRVMFAEQNKLMTYGADMYVNTLGIWADVSNTSRILGDVIDGNGSVADIYSQVPMLGLLGSMYKTGAAVSSAEWEQAYRNAKGMMILGNTAAMVALSSAAEEMVK